MIDAIGIWVAWFVDWLLGLVIAVAEWFLAGSIAVARYLVELVKLGASEAFQYWTGFLEENGNGVPNLSSPVLPIWKAIFDHGTIQEDMFDEWLAMVKDVYWLIPVDEMIAIVLSAWSMILLIRWCRWIIGFIPWAIGD